MEKRKKVLMTGAAGLVGRTLWQAWQDRYDLTLADIRPVEGARARIELADIRDYARMRALCEGQETLVHLAYVRSKHLGKVPGEESDIAASVKLFEAAREAGIQRIVYASSNAAASERERCQPVRLSTGDDVAPRSWYGAFKAMAEVAGKYLALCYGLRFISIRIGTYSGSDQARSLRECHTLLTPRDCVQLFTCAVEYEGPERYLITYGVSGNTDGYAPVTMDIGAATRVLGYQPQDNVYLKHIRRFLPEAP